MNRKFRVHFFTFRHLGKAMHNIHKNLVKHCPDWAEIVVDYDLADVTVEHSIGDHWASPFIQDRELSERIRNKDFIMLWHCFSCKFGEGNKNSFYNWVVDNAKMIFTPWPMDLYGFSNRDNIVISPWGYDEDVFYVQDAKRSREGGRISRYRDLISEKNKKDLVLATGYVAAYECIEELYQACIRANKSLLHLGHNFGWDRKYYYNFQDVSDDLMREFYNRCFLVSGLRRGEGFELPIIEGLACGCRPVVLNNIHYTRWFKEHAIFIKEEDFDGVRDQLYNILNNSEKMCIAPGCEERENIRKKFSWNTVAPKFWENLEKRL